MDFWESQTLFQNLINKLCGSDPCVNNCWSIRLKTLMEEEEKTGRIYRIYSWCHQENRGEKKQNSAGNQNVWWSSSVAKKMQKELWRDTYDRCHWRSPPSPPVADIGTDDDSNGTEGGSKLLYCEVYSGGFTLMVACVWIFKNIFRCPETYSGQK